MKQKQNGYAAQAIVEKIAKQKAFLSADDLYAALVSDGWDQFELYKVVGPAMRIAGASGMIEKTSQFVRSSRNHSQLQILWRSKTCNK